MDNGYLNFDEYIRQGEPQKRERAEAWRVAIGLQAVDGLKTSEYLQEAARRNIEGEISIDEARELVKQYYITKTAHDEDDADREEADKVSSNIAKLLQTDAFTYSVAGLMGIHRAILMVFLSMRVVLEIMIFRKKSGCLRVIRCFMADGKICAWLLNMIWSRSDNLIIRH